MGKLISVGSGATRMMGQGLTEKKRLSYDREIDFTPLGFLAEETLEVVEVQGSRIPEVVDMNSLGNNRSVTINLVGESTQLKGIDEIGGLKIKVTPSMEDRLFEGYHLSGRDREKFDNEKEYMSAYVGFCDRCGKKLFDNNDLDAVGGLGRKDLDTLCALCDEGLERDIEVSTSTAPSLGGWI